MNQSLERLNRLPTALAEAEFLKCCGSTRWAAAMAAARPFADLNAVSHGADSQFENLTKADWLEAFHAHPKIGEKKAGGPQSSEAQRWSAQEQSRTEEATADVIEALAAGNRLYQERFGFIFIVCATGKSAGEMLAILNDRLNNSPAAELEQAADEQKKITRLRLAKLLQTPDA
jgi:OHCU decarboxylase